MIVQPRASSLICNELSAKIGDRHVSWTWKPTIFFPDYFLKAPDQILLFALQFLVCFVPEMFLRVRWSTFWSSCLLMRLPFVVGTVLGTRTIGFFAIGVVLVLMYVLAAMAGAVPEKAPDR